MIIGNTVMSCKNFATQPFNKRNKKNTSQSEELLAQLLHVRVSCITYSSNRGCKCRLINRNQEN